MVGVAFICCMFVAKIKCQGHIHRVDLHVTSINLLRLDFIYYNLVTLNVRSCSIKFQTVKLQKNMKSF